MRLIKPSIENLVQGPGIQGVYDMIEYCGKTSYKSTFKGGETAKEFVSARVNEEHFAVLEFGTIYLKVPPVLNHLKYVQNPYSKVNKYDRFYYVTTNYRVIIENSWEKDLQWLCEPTEYHPKRYTVKIITDKGISHELVRHRTMSFCQESSRYCNYSKERFGGEIICIEPTWYKDSSAAIQNYFVAALQCAEDTYLTLIENGYTPQQARQILPNALKTEICMCGFEEDWQHFFDLRCAKNAHPDMQVIANMIKEEFKRCNYF